MMLEIFFGLFVLVTITIALLRRKKENKTWVKSERYEESGDWLDKRVGERGTYGSLDREMEEARQSVAREGRAAELAQMIRDFAFESYPGFHEKSDNAIRSYMTFLKGESIQFIKILEKILQQDWPDPVIPASNSETLSPMLQKKILDFEYNKYPALLDLEVNALQQLDEYTLAWSIKLLQKIKTLS